MGVHGLWNLLEPSGKIVPLETLENKVLAVDVSIWLHQAMKGFQDTKGSPLPNAHLLGLFHRICKLLFFKIKPVFVFDGGVPLLKKQTIASRQQKKNKAESDADRLREKILTNLIKHNAINSALGQSSQSGVTRVHKSVDKDDMFRLPTIDEFQKEEENRTESEDSPSSDTEGSPTKYGGRDLHTIDVNSQHFKSLPADVRHEILTELRETRKQNSWGRLHEMPKESGDFSSFQMGRLLKRRSVQVSLEQAEKEMGGHTLSLREMEEMLKEQGVNTSLNVGSRIASDNVTRYIYIKDSGNNMENNEKSTEGRSIEVSEKFKDYEKDLNCQDVENADSEVEILKEMIHDEGDWVSDDEFDQSFAASEKEAISLARNFMFENSGLTQKQILRIIKEQINKHRINKLHDNVNPQPSTSKSGLQPSTSEAHHLQPSTSKSGLPESSVNETEQPQPSTSKSGLPQPSTNKYEEPQPSTSKIEQLHLSSKSEQPQPSTSDSITRNNNEIDQDKSSQNSKHSDIEKNEIGVTEAVCTKMLIESGESTLPTPNDKHINETNTEVKLGDDIILKKSVCNNSGGKQYILQEEGPKNVKVMKTNNVADQEIEKETVSEESAGSESDFLEINSNQNSKHSERNMKKQTLFEVVIKKDDFNVEDDIFADVFTKSSAPDEDFVKCDKSVEEKSQNVRDVKPKTSLEVVIKQEDFNIEDDIFADVFRKPSGPNEEATSKNDSFTEVKNGINSKNSQYSAIEVSNEINDPEELSHVESASLKPEIGEDNSKNITKETISVNIESSRLEHSAKISSTTVANVHETSDEECLTEYAPSVEINKIQNDRARMEKLQTMKTSLEKEQFALMTERGRQERLAASITEQMNIEAQELLQLFGVPYVVAPMEAEAQCAFLDAVSLTDGTITDDSDIWLFGGQTVYKNFFNQKKHVLQFRAAEIQQYFKLTRRQLIVLALLVGSDYTTGLSGIGPVTALEIISAFPCGNEETVEAITRGLRKFREWVIKGKAAGPGRTTLRTKLKDIKLHEGFPNSAVVEAYVFPQIDHSKETFTWGTPDVSTLRNYAREKFGWTQMRTDEILLPVMKRLSERNIQKTIENYFKAKPTLRAMEGKLSKRVQKAVNRIDRGESSSENDEPLPKRKQTTEKPAKKPPNAKRKKKDEERIVTEAQSSAQEPVTSSTEVQSVGRGVRGTGRQRNSAGRARNINTAPCKQSGEFILQREKAKINSLKTKLRAIEIYRTTKLEKKQKTTRSKPKELKEANLSESSSDD